MESPENEAFSKAKSEFEKRDKSGGGGFLQADALLGKRQVVFFFYARVHTCAYTFLLLRKRTVCRCRC